MFRCLYGSCICCELHSESRDHFVMDLMKANELWTDAYGRHDVVRSVRCWDSVLELDILCRIQNDVLYKFNDVKLAKVVSL